MFDHAHWIWSQDSDNRAYHQTVEFRRSFELTRPGAASIAITADTTYRLIVNNQIVADGPCRAWNFSYQYDVIDIASHLLPGHNELRVIVRYHGCGTSHQIPQEGALLAELNLQDDDGTHRVISTDSQWTAARASSYLSNTPKASLGLGPMESIDARRSLAPLKPARLLYPAHHAPWSNLHPRDVALLTRLPLTPKALESAHVVAAPWFGPSFSPVRYLYPGLHEVGGFTCMASIAATLIINDQPTEREICIDPYPAGEGPEILVNGSPGNQGHYPLRPGTNLLLAFMEPWGHHNKEQGLRFCTSEAPRLQSPTDASDTNPWDYVVFPDLLYHENDKRSQDLDPPERLAHRQRVDAFTQHLKGEVTDHAAFLRHLAPHVRADLKSVAPLENPHWQFECRQPLPGATPDVRLAESLLSGHAKDPVRVAPDPRGDVELCYDMGTQTVGCFEIDIEAAEGTVIDLYAVEFISPDKRVQHTWACRNGFRHVCREGRNRFTSLIRRSGRYLFLTIRQAVSPVFIHALRVIESTYPVERVGSFACSDDTAVRLWETSVRTLQLCMEDVFTDCPLYEQTLWVGDARNEALFAEAVYGHLDIVRRCIRLAAEGMQLHPIVPSHVPTSNSECILPAWAFLWGRMVWDYYWYTGDIEQLRATWPDVLQNLEGARAMRDARGLFSAAAWNMFDWTNIDAGHRTVTHNSMLLVGCIDAAVKCANALGDSANAQKLLLWRAELVRAINTLWNTDKQSYIDSVHADGSLSEEVCVHTNFLALLHGIVPAEWAPAAINNMLHPTENMTQIGSPFAIQYLYEALEVCGMEERILDLIQENYVPMLDAGATTLWEQFPNGTGFNPEGFPTRSHCHAWSSAPIYFYNRLVLGIRQSEVGGSRYVISPIVSRHTWARGTSASVRGPINVEWRRDGPDLEILAKAPQGVELAYAANESHKALTVRFNGQVVQASKPAGGVAIAS